MDEFWAADSALPSSRGDRNPLPHVRPDPGARMPAPRKPYGSVPLQSSVDGAAPLRWVLSPLRRSGRHRPASATSLGTSLTQGFFLCQSRSDAPDRRELGVSAVSKGLARLRFSRTCSKMQKHSPRGYKGKLIWNSGTQEKALENKTTKMPLSSQSTTELCLEQPYITISDPASLLHLLS